MSEADLITISVGFLGALNVAYALELLYLNRNTFWQCLKRKSSSKDNRTNSALAYPILIAVSTLLIFSSSPYVDLIGGGLLSSVTLFQFSNQSYGNEGSDHIRIYGNIIYFVSGVIGVCGIFDRNQFYLAATGALGGAFYFGAGLAKCSNPEWWSGLALRKVFSTDLYGSKLIYKFLASNKFAAAFVSTSVCLWELLFIVVIHCNGPLIYLWIGIGVAFHLMVATFMRLPLFVPAAFSLYPGIFWVNYCMRAGG